MVDGSTEDQTPVVETPVEETPKKGGKKAKKVEASASVLAPSLEGAKMVLETLKEAVKECGGNVAVEHAKSASILIEKAVFELSQAVEADK